MRDHRYDSPRHDRNNPPGDDAQHPADNHPADSYDATDVHHISPTDYAYNPHDAYYCAICDDHHEAPDVLLSYIGHRST